jgi:hypothetical protein
MRGAEFARMLGAEFARMLGAEIAWMRVPNSTPRLRPAPGTFDREAA